MHRYPSCYAMEMGIFSFFAFMMAMNLSVCLSVYNERGLLYQLFAIMPHLRSHGYGGKIIDKLVDFIKEPWF